MNILHITTHLGGGAGKAVSGAAIQGQLMFGDEHRILLLQQPEKTGYVQECRENRVKVAVWSGDQALLHWADAIVVSWWNHPVMARFLRTFPQTSAALLLWCHVNGCHYPYLPFPLASVFDAVLFTSPYSLENPRWTTKEQRQVSSQVVYGMGDFHPEQIVPQTKRAADKQFRSGT